MKLFFMISLIACDLCGTGGRGQAARDASEAQPSNNSAEGVAQSFVKLDTSGARLTPDGWRSAAILFGSPDSERPTLQISVIASHYGFSN